MTIGLAALSPPQIYWANFADGTIGRANVDGTGVNQSFITGASQPQQLAVNADYIYWTDYNAGTIGRAELAGVAVNQSIVTARTHHGARRRGQDRPHKARTHAIGALRTPHAWRT